MVSESGFELGPWPLTAPTQVELKSHKPHATHSNRPYTPAACKPKPLLSGTVKAAAEVFLRQAQLAKSMQQLRLPMLNEHPQQPPVNAAHAEYHSKLEAHRHSLGRSQTAKPSNQKGSFTSSRYLKHRNSMSSGSDLRDPMGGDAVHPSPHKTFTAAAYRRTATSAPGASLNNHTTTSSSGSSKVHANRRRYSTSNAPQPSKAQPTAPAAGGAKHMDLSLTGSSLAAKSHQDDVPAWATALLQKPPTQNPVRAADRSNKAAVAERLACAGAKQEQEYQSHHQQQQQLGSGAARGHWGNSAESRRGKTAWEGLTADHVQQPRRWEEQQQEQPRQHQELPVTGNCELVEDQYLVL